MESKKKYQELNILIASINNVIGNQETKVQKKLFKIYEKLKTFHESYNAQRDELRLDNSSVDEKGILIMDAKGDYCFSKEGLKKLTKDIKELNEKEFDFNLIQVVNPNGLDKLNFLEDWTTGITFIKEEEEEL